MDRGTTDETRQSTVSTHRRPDTPPTNNEAAARSVLDGVASVRTRFDGTTIDHSTSLRRDRLHGMDTAGRTVLPNFDRIIYDDLNLTDSFRDDDDRILPEERVDRIVASAISRARQAAVFQDLENTFLDFDPATFFGFSSNDVRKPTQLACPTCMKVHLPVEGSRKIPLSESERRRLLGHCEEEKLEEEPDNRTSNVSAGISGTHGAGIESDENEGGPSNIQNPTEAGAVYEAGIFITAEAGVSRFNIRRDTFTSLSSEDSQDDLTSMPPLESDSDEVANSIHNNTSNRDGRNSSIDAFPELERMESNRIINIIGSRRGRNASFRSSEEVISLHPRHEPVGVQSVSSQSSSSLAGGHEFYDEDEEEVYSFYGRYNESSSRLSSLPALESDAENSHASEESGESTLGDDVIILPSRRTVYGTSSDAMVRSDNASDTEFVDDTVFSEAGLAFAPGPGTEIVAVEQHHHSVATDSLTRNETFLIPIVQVPRQSLGENSGYNSNVNITNNGLSRSGDSFPPASSTLHDRDAIRYRRDVVGVQSVSSREDIEDDEEDSRVQFDQANSDTSSLSSALSSSGTVSNMPDVERMASSSSAPPSPPASGADPSSIPSVRVNTQSSISSRSGPIEVEDVSSLSTSISSSVAVTPGESGRGIQSILRNSQSNHNSRNRLHRMPYNISNNHEASQSRITRGLANLVQLFEGRSPELGTNNRERESSSAMRQSSSNHSHLMQYLHNYGGLRVYATATCPICLEEVSPIVALPCGHSLCMDDYKRMGGYLASDETNAAMEHVLDRQAQEQEGPVRNRARGVASAGVQSARERIINRRNMRTSNRNQGHGNNSNRRRSLPQNNEARFDEESSNNSDVSSVSAESVTRNVQTSFRRQNLDLGSSTLFSRSPFSVNDNIPREQRGRAWGWGITRHCHVINCELSGTLHRQLWTISAQGCSPKSCYPLGSRVIEDGSGGLWIHRANGQDDMWPLLHKTMDSETEKYFVNKFAKVVSDGGEGVWALSPVERSTLYSVLIHYTGDTETFSATVPATSAIFPGLHGKSWVHVYNELNVLSRANMLSDGLWLIDDDASEKIAVLDPENHSFATSDGFGNIWLLDSVGIVDSVSVILTRYFLENQNIGNEEFPLVIERGSALYGCQAPEKFFVLCPASPNDLNGMRSLIFFKYGAVESRWDRILIGQCVSDAKIASDGNDGLWIIMEGVDDNDESSGVWHANESGMSRVFPLTIRMQSTELVGG